MSSMRYDRGPTLGIVTPEALAAGGGDENKLRKKCLPRIERNQLDAMSILYGHGCLTGGRYVETLRGFPQVQTEFFRTAVAPTKASLFREKGLSMRTQIYTQAGGALAQRAVLATAARNEGASPQIGSVTNIAQDQEIFAEGSRAEYFYKVLSGAVRTCKFLVDGRRQIDAFYLPGDIFGLEPGNEHRLSAEAVSGCTVIAYRKSKPGMLGDTDQSRELLDFAMQGMARAQDHSMLLGRRSATEKVAGFLLAWAENSDDQETLSLAMSRQDMADYLGLTIETVSRTLSQLERDRVIDLPSTRQIHLRNPEMLETLAA